MSFVDSGAGGSCAELIGIERTQNSHMSLPHSDDRKRPNGNGHFADILAEVENHPSVVSALDSTPVVRRPLREGVVTKPSDEIIPAARPRKVQDGFSAPAVVYRDVDDVRTIFNLTRLLVVLAMMALASGVVNIYQYYRRPDRIVVDGSSGRVLSINDRNYGKEEGVEFGPDRLTPEDKLYATREFVKYLYRIDPATRPRDIEKALTMMVPESAVKFAKWMKDKGVLDQQKAESWQALWSLLDISVDQNDPYTVNVIGKQEITKVVGGATEKETKQLRLTIKLVADSKGRDDRNLRSGFLISYLDSHELTDGATQGEGVQRSEADKRVTPISTLKNGQ